MPSIARRLFTALVLVIASTLTFPTPAGAEPPGIPSETTARTMLAALTVAPLGSSTGYSRDKFPHWWTVSGACNTREVVLQRDGTNVRVDSSCAAISGSWFSPYDGATWSAASDVDIDHIVPLSNAWRSGANTWTTAKREAFANDRNHPQLIAVTDNVNQAKGDQSPDQWRPPRTTYWCTYSRMWIASKSEWGLTITSSERSALADMLNRCSPTR